MVIWCYYVIVYGVEFDWIYVNYVVGIGGDVVYFDVSFARFVVFVFIDDVVLCEDFFGYFFMIVVYFGENVDGEFVFRIDVILCE